MPSQNRDLHRPTARRSAGAFLALGILSTLWSGSAHGAGDWQGTWDTFRPDGAARLVLTQDGDRVAGTYLPGRGTIAGTVADRELVGEWTDGSGDGGFRLALSGDGSTFFGRLDDGRWWTGRRAGNGETEADFEADRSSPRAALRSFLIAANNVRIEQLAFLEAALSCLDQESAADPASPRDRLGRARLFFDVLDRTTLRLTEVPEQSDEAAVTLALQQAGTDQAVELVIARRDDGWRLVVPSAAELRATLRRLLDARGQPAIAPLEHLDLASPRSAMRTFLEEYKRWDAGGRERVQAALDLSAIAPALVAAELPLLATYLKQTLDRVGYVIYQEIPDDPNRQLPYVHFRHPYGDIVIASTRREDGVVWQFTAQTLADIRAVYERIEDAPLSSSLIPEQEQAAYFRWSDRVHRHLPALTRLVWGLEAWQWLALLTTALGAAAAVLALDAGVRRANRRWRGDRRREADTGRRRRSPAPLAITAGVGLGYLVAKDLGLPLQLFSWLHAIAFTVLAIGLTWTLYSAAGWLQDFLHRRAERTVSYYDELLVSVVGSVVKFAIVILGLLALAWEAAIPLGGLVAGFSVGGLAIAIGARDTLANFFASIVLLADRPFKRGDLVRVAGHQGVVKRMGLRSTQMRTREDSLVSIPNSILVNEVIDNLGRRRLRRILGTVSVAYDTPPERLEAFAEGLRQTMLGQEEVSDMKLAAGVANLADSSIDLEYVCYVEAAGEQQEREARHKLIVAVTRLARRMGIELAFPTRTIHLADPLPGLSSSASDIQIPPEGVLKSERVSEGPLDHLETGPIRGPREEPDP